MNIIRHIRVDLLDLTQTEFAEGVGVAQSTVSRWEKSELSPSIKEAAEMRRLMEEKGIEWDDAHFFDSHIEPNPTTSITTREAAQA